MLDNKSQWPIVDRVESGTFVTTSFHYSIGSIPTRHRLLTILLGHNGNSKLDLKQE